MPIVLSNHLNKIQTQTEQKGAVLAISLIILLLLAMIGGFGMQNAMLQERMAGNNRDKDLAFQAAEASLKLVQRSLSDGTLANFNANGDGGLYSKQITPNSNLTDDNLSKNDAFWTGTNAKVATDQATIDLLKHTTETSPGHNTALGGVKEIKYIVEELDPINGSPAYKITVRSTGQNDKTVVILQAIYTTS